MKCGTGLTLACAKCNTELPAGAAFCFACGQPVTAAPSRQRFTAPDAYTPKHLVEKILTSKAALEGERKQVTVLFADLKGSMELLADRDPEEARKLLDPVLERMMEAVHRYEGTVNQVMGDGIMALFGAPLAHEDHAVRACYAALRMQESVAQYAEGVFRSQGVPIQIRVGLNSGEVVVRAIGSDLRMDYTAVGQTTHLAARMEQMATPGTILLAPATLQLAEGYVQVAPRGPVAVKGLPDPVEIYALTGASGLRTRFHAAAARGLTRFVGRDAEMEQIRRALGLAQDGRGQLVAIVGEPGVGKSRLVYEFTHSHRTQEWLILEAGSVSYGKATSYLPVIDLLKAYFKVHERETHREIREKVTGKLLTLDRTLEPILPAVLALLDVPVEDAHWQALDPPQRRQRTLEAIKHLLLRESQGQPVLVVFEDLHWIDSETQALLDSLVESLPTARILLLVNYRPEYQHGWMSRTYYSQLRLDALPPESAAELLSALLGDDPGLEPLKRLLVRRGNPFFIEESIRTLVETGALAGERSAYRLTRPIQAIEVPATVQVILAARIDRLSTEDKRLLQTASVIGKDVPLVLLQAVGELPEDATQRGLTHLQAAEFLYETRLFPDPEYTFKHALTHEVAYGSLLHERRLALHGRVLAAIERLYAERLAEHVERLAHHALRGERWEKAVEYSRQAGARAMGRSAHSEGRSAFEQALRALEHLPETRQTQEQAIDLRFELRTALLPFAEFEQIGDVLRIAERLAFSLGDQHRQARASVYIGVSHYVAAEHEPALRAFQRAQALGEALGDVGLQAVVSQYQGYVHCARTDFVQAARFLRRCTETLTGDLAGQRFGQVMMPAIASRAFLAWGLAELGDFEAALEVGEEGLQLAEATGHPATLLISAWGAGVAQVRRGRAERAIPLLERSLDICQRGLPIYFHYIGAALGPAYALGGDLSHGIAILEETIAHDRRVGFMANHALTLTSLGEMYAMNGRLDDAAGQAEQALTTARTREEPGHEAYALHLVGEIAAQREPLLAEKARDAYRRAIALAETTGLRPLQAHCQLGLGKLYGRMGKRQEAQEHFTIAMTMYREMDMRFWLEKAKAGAEELA
jgi:class 3 adenylate cyclase/tetratricopeptide (TPR) repeat protein